MATTEVRSEIAGKVWKIEAAVGQRVAEDEPIVILESMKMEIPVPAPTGGTVLELRVSEEETVDEGDVVAVLETS